LPGCVETRVGICRPGIPCGAQSPEIPAVASALPAGDLADIASAARASDPAAASKAVQQLIADSQQIRDARAAFERALDGAAN